MPGRRATWCSALVATAGAALAAACGGTPGTPLPTAGAPSASADAVASQPAAAPADPGAATPAAPAGTAPVAPATPPASPAPPAASAPPSVLQRAAPRALTLAFAGDVHTEGPAAKVATTGLGEVAALLSAADVAVLNLETAVVTREDVAPEPKTYTFRTSPEVLGALAADGVDAVSLANNHGMDYGREGLADSLAVRAAVPAPAVLGIGADDTEAWAPWVVEAGGRTVGVLGVTDVLDDTGWAAGPGTPGLASAKGAGERRLVAETQALAARVDVAVVFLHWGRELEVCPTERQRELAALLVAAGADVVAGSHAHVLQPVTTVGGATVAYGLGNFAWYHSREPSSITGVLTVTVEVDGTQRTSWQPAVIRDGLPVPEGAAVAVPATGCG